MTGKQGALLTKKKLCWGYLIESGRLTEEIPYALVKLWCPVNLSILSHDTKV